MSTPSTKTTATSTPVFGGGFPTSPKNMSLSSTSNTINALGIFGRLESGQEKYFKALEDKYSQISQDSEAVGIFSHLSLVIEREVPVGKLSRYLDLLRELRPFLPFKLETNGVIIKDSQHLALSFDTIQTQPIREVAKKFIPEGVVTTHYTKIVWFVPKQNQEKAIKELKKTKEMIFYDFKLVANRQDDANTIYSSMLYK
ncbi:MAG: hypothetical protein HYS86_03975 [Candidatus Chisholmbacteria bacterium]|nr:hypothetical protein [Candidatus Chisholmbacteria bacterium]